MLGAQNITGLFDLGFGPTLQRKLAFAKAARDGDRQLEIELGDHDDQVALLSMARAFYGIAAASVFLGLLLVGWLYQLSLRPEDLAGLENVGTAWFVVAVGFAAATSAWYIDSSLNGLGEIGWPSVVATVVGLVALVCTWATLVCGGGLVGVAVVWALKGIATRLIGRAVLVRLHPWTRRWSDAWKWGDLRAMIRPSLEIWLTSLASFFLAGAPRYFIGSILGLNLVAPFEVARLVLGNLQSLFVSIATVSTPLLSQGWRAVGAAGLRRLIFPTVRIALPLLIGACGLIVVYGNTLFTWWLGPGRFVGNTVFGILALQMLLEAHHGMLQAPCVAAGELQFCKYQFTAGLVCVSMLPISISAFGIVGAALAITVPRMVTDNWIIPVFSLRLMKMRFGTYAREILLPGILVGGGFAVSARVLQTLVLDANARVILQTVLAGTAVGLWWLTTPSWSNK
jgi:O-antigen/teichoic acid export membrane protein